MTVLSTSFALIRKPPCTHVRLARYGKTILASVTGRTMLTADPDQKALDDDNQDDSCAGAEDGFYPSQSCCPE
ncbi:hypothetical protein DPMN_066119 [Dreissena polymorpha]|uniref:Uncharacterized protein n=1 Tax=Dreissena polymorpha TaxID=45954 RepID=A0A9D3YX67_DREPO|nr:hypothetical protein DPMN_066119 [Dreissena polymorpha]